MLTQIRKTLFNSIPAYLPEPCELLNVKPPPPFTNAFNGSIVGNLYAARLDKFPFFRDRKIAVWQWNNAQPTNPRIVNFKTDNGHAEDPRCFDFNGRPACLFNDGNKMYLGFFDTSECIALNAPKKKSEDYDGREKNWSPFVYNGRLHLMYSAGHIVEYDGTNPVNEYITEAPKIKGGHIRGGSQIVEHKGKLYSIFHVKTDYDFFVFYWAGVMVMENKPPFKILQCSKYPFWKPSFIADGRKVPQAPHTGYEHIGLFVTFPTHLQISDKGEVFILAGHHDFRDAIIQTTIKEVKKHLKMNLEIKDKMKSLTCYKWRKRAGLKAKTVVFYNPKRVIDLDNMTQSEAIQLVMSPQYCHLIEPIGELLPEDAPDANLGAVEVSMYCINLARATERRAKVEQEFKREGLSVQFIEAIDAKQIESKQPAAFKACLLSHAKAIEQAVGEYALIFEDDVELIEGFDAKLREAVAELPANFLFAQLNGLVNSTAGIHGCWQRVSESYSAFAYLLNLRYRSEVLRMLNERQESHNLDEVYAMMQPHHLCYKLTKPIAFHAAGYSYREGKNPARGVYKSVEKNA